MTKTLNTVQTIMKVGRIIAKIVSVVCIIGAVGSLFGLGALIGTQGLQVSVGGTTVAGLIVSEAGMSIENMYLACVLGIVTCIVEAVLAWFAIRYFNHELAAGTPFTFDGAKELFRLGIINLCVMLGLSVLQGVIFGIFWVYFPTIEEPDTTVSLSTGLAMLMLSLVFKHGAEISSPYDASFGDDVKEEIRF